MEDANAAMTLLEKLPEKSRALNGIRTHDLCVTGAMLYQLSYQLRLTRHISTPPLDGMLVHRSVTLRIK